MPDAWIRAWASPGLPLADVAAPNELRDEGSAAFFELWLGPRMKYSCGLWPTKTTTLAQSEDAMLALSCERAGLEDGMDVLDLGTGWGALALWIGERHPRSRVLAITDSESQAAFVRARADARGQANVSVQCADARTFEPTQRFDRVVSVEMFERVHDYEHLLARISGWLRPDGRAFLHQIAGRDLACPPDLRCMERWTLNGSHYARTLEAWLMRLTAAREAAITELTALLGPGKGDRRRATRRWRRWRILLMACAERFRSQGGEAWPVVQSVFAPDRGSMPG